MTEEIQQVPATTPNFQTEIAQQLSELLPEVVADGKIDIAALQAVLGDDAAGGGSVLVSSGPVRKKLFVQHRLLQPQP